MKKTFLLILVLLALRPMAMAQGALKPLQPIQAGNLVLNLNFSPLPGSPGTNQPSGTANYYYLYFDNQGNSFSVSLSLGPNPATDGWLLQKNNDGSYTPVMELTNEDRSYSYRLSTNSFLPLFIPVATNYLFAQSWQLTMEQVHALVAGKWYAEVSYGDDEYIANLSPTYIEPPSAA